MNKQRLKQIVLDILEMNGPLTKKQIKTHTYEYAVKNGILTKDFVIAYGDIGWVFQHLKPLVEVTKIDGKWLWERV